MTKHTAIRLSLLASSLTLALAAGAQTQSTVPDPLVQAVRKAVASNPEVQAKWNGFLAADNLRDIAKAGFLPQIDLTGTVGNESRVSGAINLGTYDFSSAQVTLNQILFDGNYTSNEVKRLGAAKLTRYYELLEAAETAALEATRAYADVVRYRELVDLATQNYVEHKQSAQLVEERAKAGVGRRVDVEQANGRLALAESNLLTELTNLHDVSARFLRIVGEQPASTLPSLPEPFRIAPLPQSTQDLLRDGLRNSPTLLAAVENAKAGRTAVDSAKASLLPRLDFQVYGSQGRNNGGSVGDSRSQGVALNLTYNLFRGGADKAREKQAVNLAAQARDLQEKACRDTRQTLSLAYNDSRSLSEQLIYIDKHRLAAEKTREAYRQQFDIGQRTLLDLLDTQNEFFEASRSYINSRHEQATAQARTLAAMGNLVSTLGAGRSDIPSAADAGADGAGISPADLCPLETSVMDSLEKIKAELVITPRAKPVAVAPVASPTPSSRCGRVVLLPDEDGGVGHVDVAGSKGGEVKLDQPYTASFDDCNKVVMGKVDPAAYQASLSKLPAPARIYRFNFALGRADIAPQSDGVLKSIVEDYKSTVAPEVIIVGHADKLGNPSVNLDLSQRRAKAVFELLTKEGAVPSTDIEQAWRGDKEPLPGTEDSSAEPRNRRVDVKVQ